MSTETQKPAPADVRRVTTQTLQEMKAEGVPVAMLTAYDYTSARILDGAGVDVLLVGDSASNVMASSRKSVVDPIALATTPTSCPCSTAAAMESAARFTRSPLPSEVPPNLATTRIVSPARDRGSRTSRRSCSRLPRPPG